MSTPARPRGSGGDLLASRDLGHVVVLGANGTMGYGSGALFARAVPRVTFLARTRDKAEQGLRSAIRQVRSQAVAGRVDVGCYDDDFDAAVGSADLIFEAVAERLELKHEIFERVDRVRRPASLVATVTSGLSITALAKPRSESFRRNFFGLHFFNPPNAIVGTELIPGEDSDPAVLDWIDELATARLGREVVRAADRPGFAGNRVGFKVLNEVVQLAEEHGPWLMDRLLGRYTGRALAPLATVDLVGWDIHASIVDNIYALCPDDEARATLKMPAYMGDYIDGGTLGNKVGRGFFKRDGRTRLALDPKTGDYTPVDQLDMPDLSFIDRVADLHRVGRHREAMAELAAAEGPHAAIARKVIAGYIAYSFNRVGEVTESISGIDRIMGFGFHWAPPCVLVDLLGPEATVAMIEEAGLAVPEALRRAIQEAGSGALFTVPHVDEGRFFIAT